MEAGKGGVINIGNLGMYPSVGGKAKKKDLHRECLHPTNSESQTGGRSAPVSRAHQ